MELLTEELIKIFKEHPLGCTEKYEVCGDTPILAHYFLPNWDWYVTEAEKQDDGDWLFFGYVKGFANEFGYFTMRQLKSITGPLGLGVERDIYPTHKTLKDVGVDF